MNKVQKKGDCDMKYGSYGGEGGT